MAYDIASWNDEFYCPDCRAVTSGPCPQHAVRVFTSPAPVPVINPPPESADWLTRLEALIRDADFVKHGLEGIAHILRSYHERDKAMKMRVRELETALRAMSDAAVELGRALSRGTGPPLYDLTALVEADRRAQAVLAEKS
jgi:hypothetical protein